MFDQLRSSNPSGEILEIMPPLRGFTVGILFPSEKIVGRYIGGIMSPLWGFPVKRNIKPSDEITIAVADFLQLVASPPSSRHSPPSQACFSSVRIKNRR